jgi:HK97 family phage portal protein
MIAKTLSRLGFAFRKDSPPIINDGRGNLPSVRVRYVSTFGGSADWAGYDYEALAAHGYKRNSDVYACVSLIAQAGKQVKWDTSVGSQGVRSVELLKKAGGANFIETWLSYLLLSGNDYIEIERNFSRVPINLHLLSPAIVTAVPDNAAHYRGVVEMWKARNARGYQYPILPADMVHSRLFNPTDPIYGMAPLEAAMMRVEAENQGAALLADILKRGYAPGWIEAAKDSIWEETQVSQLKAHIRDSKSRGEELFLENASWHQMGFQPADSGISEGHILTKRDIASVFHVDPALIGDTTGRTYATYRESRQALYMEAVIPLLTEFRDDWNATIGKDLQSPLEFDKDSFDAINSARAEAADRVQKLWASGLLMQNEARRELNYDPVDGGDVFFAPANFLPLADARPESEGAGS